MSPSRTIAGRYLIEHVLGEGGMGRVYLARHLELGERVAVKVIRTEHTAQRSAAERLRREARASAKMRGENLARVIDAGVCETHGPFLVMEFVEGRSLSAVLDADGPLSVTRATLLVLQACAGLAEAHSLGVVHRDIKPSNLLLTQRPDGTELLKVVDFGIAKADALASCTLTDSHGLLGSPKYMSPEQVRGAREVDPRSDVWSLGVVLYELLTGRLPFEAFTAGGVLAQIAADGPTPPRTYVATLPPALEALVLRTLSKDPESRQASVAVLASELAPFGGDEGGAIAATVNRIAATERTWSRPPLAPDDDVPARLAPADVTSTATPSVQPPSPARPPPWGRAIPFAGLAGVAALVVTVFAARSAPVATAAATSESTFPRAPDAVPARVLAVSPVVAEVPRGETAPPPSTASRTEATTVTATPARASSSAVAPSATSVVTRRAQKAVGSGTVDLDLDFGPRR